MCKRGRGVQWDWRGSLKGGNVGRRGVREAREVREVQGGERAHSSVDWLAGEHWVV